MPSPAGLCAHIELARISGYIVSEAFKIAPRNYQPGHSIKTIDKAIEKLENWKLQLPSELRIPHELDPACCTLHMAQNQLLVLTTRPIFLAVVKQALAARFMNGYWSAEQHLHGAYLRVCSDAAYRNLILAQRLRPARKFLQAGLHFVFNAAVVLLLNRILYGAKGTSVGLGHKTLAVPGDNFHAHEVQFAIHVFEQEAKTGTNYARDCFRVLQDLRALIDHYMSQSQESLQQRVCTGGDCVDTQTQGNTSETSGVQSLPMDASKTNELYQELQTWVQSDGLQLRNGLLM